MLSRTPPILTVFYNTYSKRIYIKGEFTRKKCKTAILFYCFHIAGVLHIFMLQGVPRNMTVGE